MCLDRIHGHVFYTRDHIEEAYKVFRKTKMGNYNFEIFQRSKSFKMGQFLIDRKYMTIGSEHNAYNRYQTGFHCWRTLTAARQWKDSRHSAIVKVRVWDIRARGIQNGYICFVGKRMQLIEEIT